MEYEKKKHIYRALRQLEFENMTQQPVCVIHIHCRLMMNISTVTLKHRNYVWSMGKTELSIRKGVIYPILTFDVVCFTTSRIRLKPPHQFKVLIIDSTQNIRLKYELAMSNNSLTNCQLWVTKNMAWSETVYDSWHHG